MELVWLLDGGRVKRKSPRGACANCRVRKKRCSHDDKEPRKHPSVVESKHKTDYVRAKENPVRFIGYLNPLADILDQSRIREEDQVGVWLEQEERYLVNHSLSTSTFINNNILEPPEAMLPPPEDQGLFMDMYFLRIHPVLPLLDEAEFRAGLSTGNIPPQLIQGICLIVSKESGDHQTALRLGTSPQILDIDTFTDTLYKCLLYFSSTHANRRNITTIQLLALMSLHASGPDGTEEASLHLMHAIHHAQTLGLHISRWKEGQQVKSHIPLFWCLWSLDRWNAAINGRPAFLGNQDMQSKMDEVLQCSDAPFRIWLQLAACLDQIICLYRPPNLAPERQKTAFRTFEQIVEEANGYWVSESTLISLELLYHGISILSCGGSQGVLIPSLLQTRQSLSTIQLTSIIRSGHARTLLALPMTAYSISLCLSASYKYLRNSKLPTTRHMARANLKACCQILSHQALIWWSAGAISRLGQRALDELGPIQEPCSCLADPRHPAEQSVHAVGVGQSEGSHFLEPVNPVSLHNKHDNRLNEQVAQEPMLVGSALSLDGLDDFPGDFLDLNIYRLPADSHFIGIAGPT